ncbi:hypothetical protein [Clostridium sp.]|uniref:hypothetical protein n=2 Tax=unclassified Clostridium TaxID=2614128 RepID=UPI001B634B01|nr:hypothetical protein [Clostridium sp.]MBP3914436.1 hypothetical protein [Clostridium sp.]MEE0933895.1 hypothetical protein [Clostridium sp.]
MMHKEIKRGKKTVAIIISLLTITVALYIHQFSKMTFGKNITEEMGLEVILVVLTLIVLIKETKKCKMAYKYCVISDKLIINKINSKVEENVESLKIKDIIYIGEKSNVPKEYSKCKCSRHYIRKFDKNKKFLCIYRKQGKIYKFIFEPSDALVARIKHSI